MEEEFNNVRHVIQELYLIQRCKIASLSVIFLLTMIGMLASVFNAFLEHSSTVKLLYARIAVLVVSLAYSALLPTHLNA